MLNLDSFVRATPPGLLGGLLLQVDEAIELPHTPVSADRDWKRSFKRVVEGLPKEKRHRFDRSAERLVAMSDEAGEVAILGLGQHKETLEALPSRHARATWLSLHDPEAFKHAEEIRFTDERRGGRMWGAFIGLKDVVLKRDDGSLERFKASLREHFESPNVHVEIFDRHRPDVDDTEHALVQVTIYREDLPNETLEFVEGALATRMVRPVIEAALTYEKATGAIEAVSNRRQTRDELVRLFSRDLLQAEVTGEKPPLRRYDLQVLATHQRFPTDPEDGIESVRVALLRLMPLATTTERVTLECMATASTDIWQMSEGHFGSTDPLAGGWLITQAKLVIRFRPEAGSNRSRSLPVTISMPHGCDLKERTERERLIAATYLRRWGLVQDI
jgi:hypothetical protein